MNVYPSTFTSQGPLKEKEGLSEDFTDLPIVTHTQEQTHACVAMLNTHTLRAHMLFLTLIADLPSVPL